eukprot:TRINITY_DN6685_c0_g1_i1.p1 TRINITY_DN6685_c0_g1~~TRINITY_DN6685_c0_g1_i1.p1  ORF type:complete len:351 (-),score=44.14 TRINITY_DN6685_c0_g1_i1:151-1098(-)
MAPSPPSSVDARHPPSTANSTLFTPADSPPPLLSSLPALETWSLVAHLRVMGVAAVALVWAACLTTLFWQPPFSCRSLLSAPIALVATAAVAMLACSGRLLVGAAWRAASVFRMPATSRTLRRTPSPSAAPHWTDAFIATWVADGCVFVGFMGWALSSTPTGVGEGAQRHVFQPVFVLIPSAIAVALPICAITVGWWAAALWASAVQWRRHAQQRGAWPPATAAAAVCGSLFGPPGLDERVFANLFSGVFGGAFGGLYACAPFFVSMSDFPDWRLTLLLVPIGLTAGAVFVGSMARLVRVPALLWWRLVEGGGTR